MDSGHGGQRWSLARGLATPGPSQSRLHSVLGTRRPVGYPGPTAGSGHGGGAAGAASGKGAAGWRPSAILGGLRKLALGAGPSPCPLPTARSCGCLGDGGSRMFSEGHGGRVWGWEGSKFRSRCDVSGLQESSLWGRGSWDSGIGVQVGSSTREGGSLLLLPETGQGWLLPFGARPSDRGPGRGPAPESGFPGLLTTAFTVQRPGQRMPPSPGSWAPPAWSGNEK